MIRTTTRIANVEAEPALGHDGPMIALTIIVSPIHDTCTRLSIADAYDLGMALIALAEEHGAGK